MTCLASFLVNSLNCFFNSGCYRWQTHKMHRNIAEPLNLVDAMKNSMNKVQDTTAQTQEPCSEKKCATCFQNNGCMFEQYPGAAIHNIEELSKGNNLAINSTIGKRA